MRTGIHSDGGGAVVKERGIGVVDERHAHEEVLVAPGVVVVAAGVEAGRDVGRSDGKDDRAAAAGRIAVLVLLLPELSGGEAELGGVGAAVGEESLALGIAAVGKLETDLVDGVRRVVDLAVGIGAGIVGGGVAGDDLEILVAVIPLLLGEADGGVDLVVERGEVVGLGAGGVDETGGGDHGGLLRVVVAVVDEHIAGERAARLHMGSRRRVGNVEIFAACHAA